MEAETLAGEKAVTAAMREASTGLKTAWRAQADRIKAETATAAAEAKAAEKAARSAPAPARERAAPRARTSSRQTPMEALTKSVLRTAGSTITRELLRGVRFSADSAVTSSLVMRSRTGAVRTIETRHRLSTSTLFTGGAETVPAARASMNAPLRRNTPLALPGLAASRADTRALKLALRLPLSKLALPMGA